METSGFQPTWWKPRNLLLLLGCLLISHGAGVIGLITSPTPGSWYRSLTNPAGTPPGYVFGLVWPVLYTLIGISLFIYILRSSSANLKYGLYAFTVQWLLNTLWTPLFFGLHKPVWALFDIILLLGAILVTGKIFYRESRWAGLLLVPYFIWSLYACYLNVGFVLLNA